MRVVLQRVNSAEVRVSGEVSGQIERGILVLLGVETDDSRQDAEWMADKIVQLRIFPDEEGKMNLDVKQAGGDILVVSQFTLFASTRKGNRPSFIRSARPEVATPLYEYFIAVLETSMGRKPQSGVFGAMMEVSLVNDGPVTIHIDSKSRE